MERIMFEVQGSQESFYQVEFVYDRNELLVFCTCPAGNFSTCCKHRLRLLAGDPEGVRDLDSEALDLIQRWLSESQLQAAFDEYRRSEVAFRAAKVELSRTKRRLGKLMQGKK